MFHKNRGAADYSKHFVTRKVFRKVYAWIQRFEQSAAVTYRLLVQLLQGICQQSEGA